MALKRKKIALFFMGGADLVDKNHNIIQVNNRNDIDRWNRELPELKIMAQLTPFFITNKPCEEINIADWVKLAQEIYDRHKRFDGFIVTHGSETVLYTANAVKCILKDFPKPVVFTGSQVDMNKLKQTDDSSIDANKNYDELSIKVNLISSLQVAVLGISEVSIMFGNRLIRIDKAIRSNMLSLNTFDSIDNDFLGRADFSIKLVEKKSKKRSKIDSSKNRFNSNIAIIHLTPLISMDEILSIADGKDGVIMYVYDGMKYPAKLINVIKDLSGQMTVVLYSPSAIEDKKLDKRTVMINSISLEALIVRVMWALGQTKNSEKIKELILFD